MRWPWQRRDDAAATPEHAASQPAAAVPVAPMGWAFLPALQRQVGEMPLVTRPTAFPADLPAWRNPSFTGTLAHGSSADAPSGVIDADGGGSAVPQVRTESRDLTLLAPEPVRPPVQRATVAPSGPPGSGSSPGTGASLTTATSAELPVLAVASHDTPAEGPRGTPAVSVDEHPPEVDRTDEGVLPNSPDAVAAPLAAAPQLQRSVAADHERAAPRHVAIPLGSTAAPAPELGRRLGLGAPLAAMPPASDVPAVQRSASPSLPPVAGEGAQGYVEVPIPVPSDRAVFPAEPVKQMNVPTLGAGTPDREATGRDVASDHPEAGAHLPSPSAPPSPVMSLQRSRRGEPDEGHDIRPPRESRPTAVPTAPTEPPPDVVGFASGAPTGPTPEPPTEPVQRAAESAATVPILGATSVSVPVSGGPADTTASADAEDTTAPALHVQRAVVGTETDEAEAAPAARPPRADGTAVAQPAGREPRPSRTGGLALQRGRVLDTSGTDPGAPGDGEPAGKLPPPGSVVATEAPGPRRDPTSLVDVSPPSFDAAPSRPTLTTHASMTALSPTVQRLVQGSATAPQPAGRWSLPGPSHAPAPQVPTGSSAVAPARTTAQLPALQRFPSVPITTLPQLPAVPGRPLLGEAPTLPALPDAAPTFPTLPALPTAPAVPDLPVPPTAPAAPMTDAAPAGQGLSMPLAAPAPLVSGTPSTSTPSAVAQIPVVPETAVPTEGNPASGETAAEPGAPATAAGPGAGADAAGGAGASSPEQLEALAQRLFTPLMRRIRTEMLLDRERRGLRTDSW